MDSEITVTEVNEEEALREGYDEFVNEAGLGGHSTVDRCGLYIWIAAKRFLLEQQRPAPPVSSVTPRTLSELLLDPASAEATR